MLIFVEFYGPSTPGEALRYRRCEWDGDKPVSGSEESGPIRDLDDLAAALSGAEVSKRSEYSLDELPAFDDDDKPADTRGVVSWDEDRVLVSDGAGGIALHARG